jgi:cysteinyl-tRNA synthetase
MHHGWVVDESGEKMSKSLGNVDNLLDLLERYDGRVYRLILLQSHYRSPARIGGAVLENASKTLAGLDSFAARTVAIATDRPSADVEVLDAFRDAMDDDLDTPTAMAVLFDTVRRANTLLDSNDRDAAAPLVAAVRQIATAVGFVLGGSVEVPDEIAARATAVDEARAAKDYATADEIRAALQADGWIVETTANGTTVRR